MYKPRKSILLSGVLVVFLIASHDSVAQNVKPKEKMKISVSISKRDSVQALNQIQLELKIHQKTLNLLNQRYLNQNQRLRNIHYSSDSIKSAGNILVGMDSSSLEFRTKDSELTVLASELERKAIILTNERVVLNRDISAANNKSKNLLIREMSLKKYLGLHK